MYLGIIPYKDFSDYIFARLPMEDQDKRAGIVEEILAFTRLHPYYTQQLSAQVWEMMNYDQDSHPKNFVAKFFA